MNTIPTTPPGQPLNQSTVKHDPSTEAKLAELRKANEERRRSEATNLHIATEGKAPDVKAPDARPAKPREETAPFPRSLRAIASDGNVLRAESWPWKREPTAAELEAFRVSVPGAATVDVVDSKL